MRERVEEARHGHGRKAWTEQIKTRLVGIEALTTYDDYGSEEHSRQRNRGVMALCTAFRLWKAQEERTPQDEPVAQPESQARPQAESQPLEITLLGGEGTERWRRRLKAENRDRVIVFVGEQYGICHVAELAVLSGLRIKASLKSWAPPRPSSPATASAPEPYVVTSEWVTRDLEISTSRRA